MAIYRAEQSRLSFCSEFGNLPGGYPEVIDTTTDASDWTGVINMSSGVAAGERAVTFDGASGTLAVGNYVLIGTAGNSNAEIRRVISLGSYNGTGATGTIYLDYPVGFFHADDDTIDERTNAAPSGTAYTSESSPIGGINFASFLPGVWETVSTPDLTPELMPQYFNKTTSDRNWAYMYRGRQTFQGSVPNIILLNGFPMKYPFGHVYSTGTDSGGGGGSDLDETSGVNVGEREVTVTSATGYAAGDYIQIGTGTTAEVRQIIAVATNTLTLNYPLTMAHSDAETCNEVVSPYTHTFSESAQLPRLTWHLSMRDSGETAANDFIRRYVGGTVNRATLNGDEGELIRYSWDEVIFTDLVHNQTRHTGVTGDGAGADIMDKSSNMLIQPLGIGAHYTNSGGALAAATFPTTEPYYFSYGVLTMFGVEFARVRNFRFEINNNVEPRYYINDVGGKRVAREHQEGRREYSFSCTIALPDSASASATAATLWKELILEGNYAGTPTGALTGFDMTLVFTRGANDTITITSPTSSATSAFDSQGCFFRRAVHNITTDSPLQVDGEILMRSVQVQIVDSNPVYP
jgi:hypothetical protein